MCIQEGHWCSRHHIGSGGQCSPDFEPVRTLILDCSLQHCEQDECTACKLPGLRHSVIAAGVEEDSGLSKGFRSSCKSGTAFGEQVAPVRKHRCSHRGRGDNPDGGGQLLRGPPKNSLLNVLDELCPGVTVGAESHSVSPQNHRNTATAAKSHKT